MFAVGVISWWYGDGWKWRARLLRARITRTLDFFSFGLLAKTLFAPFRQISAGSVNGSLSVKLHAFADRLISRCIGAMLRTTMMIAGGVVVLFQTVIGSIMLISWAIIPLLPFIGIIFWTIGWVPAWTR